MTLHVMNGPPGSGKSYYVEGTLKLLNSTLNDYGHIAVSISSDDVRKRVLEDFGYPDYYHPADVPKIHPSLIEVIERVTWGRVFNLIKQELKIGHVVFMDSASLLPEYIDTYKAINDIYGWDDLIVIMLDTPYKVCKNRNIARKRVVPPNVFDEMYQLYKDNRDEIIEKYNVVHVPYSEQK